MKENRSGISENIERLVCMGQELEKESTEIENEDLNNGQKGVKEEKLEDIIAQVEQCIARLEDPQASLEDSFRYYEQGVAKLKLCNEKVEQIEKKMLMINSQGELAPFMD